jgi:hypothetical protein
MSLQQRTLDNQEQIVNTKETLSPEPYGELCWKALRSALAHMETRWLYLDRETRLKLEDDGLDKADLQTAINYGVRAGLLVRKVIYGVPCIKLARKAAVRR